MAVGIRAAPFVEAHRLALLAAEAMPLRFGVCRVRRADCLPWRPLLGKHNQREDDKQRLRSVRRMDSGEW